MALASLTACPGEAGQDEPPDLGLDVRSEETYVAGQDVVQIVLTATDPQGLELEFEAVEVPERSTFQTFRNQAVFNWDPIISDVTDGDPHRLVFAVTNEAGLTTERTVLIHVVPGQEGTRFVSSSSQLYDPTSGAPLEFDVRARNEQLPQVILSMPADRAPEGATFEQVDDFEGRFHWRPSPAQLDKRIHSVVFEADDDTEVVEQEVTIIIQDPSAGGGTSPGGGNGGATSCSDDQAISHQPLGAQRTAAAFEVTGSIDDTSRDWVDVVLYWTFDDPIGPAPQYESRVLEIDDDNSFTGRIDNPLLDLGESVEVSYVLCAFDGTGDDEGFTCSPEEFFYRFIAYSPDDEKCRDDGVDFGSPDSAGPISTSAWEAYRVCEDLPKYHSIDLDAGEILEVAFSFSAALTPDLELTVDGTEVELEILPCIGLAYAVVEGPAEVLARVQGEDLPYHITGFYDVGECRGAHYEPNDTPGQATLLVEDFVYLDDLAICTADDRDVFAVELVRGDQFDAMIEFFHSDGDLDMTLFAPSQSTEVVEDGFGVAQGWSTTDDESISYVAEESGFHYLSVVTIDEPNEYELLSERVCVVDDPYAGNHSMVDALPIEVGFAEEGLKLCALQADWYEITHDSDEDVSWLGEVRLDYGSALALDIQVYDNDLNVVAQGEIAGSSVDFYLDPEPFETYLIEIQSTQPSVYHLSHIEVAW